MSSTESESGSETETESTVSSDDFLAMTHLNSHSVKGEIRYVYHVSDIHIRNTQRHEEYREVFAKLYQFIATNRDQLANSIIIVTGDIMHTKTELSPEAVSLAHHFFRNLSDLTTVVVIPGNHDCNLSNRSRMDALTPIIQETGQFVNLFYLKHTGLYCLNNIVIGYTSIFDEKLITAKKITRELWSTLKYKNKYRLALYHGAVHASELDVGFRMNREELTVRDFDGYDYVMLGDIHKFQYLDESKRIAYAGSLIQQSHGEKMTGHGVLKWDLLMGSSEFHEIPNNYGFCTVDITNGVMTPTLIPPKARIRFRLNNTNNMQFHEVFKAIEADHEICGVVRENKLSQPGKLRADDGTGSSDSETMGSDRAEEIRTYPEQMAMIKKYLANGKISEPDQQAILDLHAEIYREAVGTQPTVAEAVGQKWCLLELCFSNMLSYGPDNVIDFRKYQRNQIIGILAPNRYGKSAILDIILFCLFDKFSRDRPQSIINMNSREMHCSLLFAVGHKNYFIERRGELRGSSLKVDVDFECREGSKSKSLNGLNRTETNQKIQQLIGDYQDYLTTCFCLQQPESNFTDMTPLQKKRYLSEILHLNYFDVCHDNIKARIKANAYHLQELENRIKKQNLPQIKSDIRRLYADIAIQKAIINPKNHQFRNQYLQLGDNEPEPLVKYAELQSFDLTSMEKIRKVQSQLKSEINASIEFDLETLACERQNLQQLQKAQMAEIATLQTQISQLEIQQVRLQGKTETLQTEYQALTSKYQLCLQEKQDVDTLQNHLANLTQKADDINAILALGIRRCRHTIQQEISELMSKRQCINPNVKNRWITLFANTTEYYRCELAKIRGLGKELTPTQITILETEIKVRLEVCDFLTQIPDSQLQSQPEIQNWLQYQHEIISSHRDTLALQNYVLNNNTQPTLPNSAKIVATGREYLASLENQIIDHQIMMLKSELASAPESTEILNSELDLLNQKIKMIRQQLDLSQEFQTVNVTQTLQDLENRRKELVVALNETTNDLSQKQRLLQQTQHKLHSTNERIAEIDKSFQSNSMAIKNRGHQQHQLVLTELYMLRFWKWQQMQHIASSKKAMLQNWQQETLSAEKMIMKLEADLARCQQQLTEYLDCQNEFDALSKKQNICEQYLQLTSPNGLPYEILRGYLPHIESDINKILHAITDFDVEIVDKANTIDVNLVTANNKPRNIRSACGFEKFIVGLAVRMTLIHISLTAKPNFLIIDEGWGCLDSENINNIGPVIEYIKTLYDHVVLISHRDELKSQVDYVINIEILNSKSHIQTHYAKTCRRKKLKI